MSGDYSTRAVAKLLKMPERRVREFVRAGVVGRRAHETAKELRFDFRNALSNNVPVGRVADTFFATLYFTNNAATFDIQGGAFDRAVPLFDLDSAGPFNVNGTIGPSSKGTGWSLFATTFQNTHGFIVPAFELRDFNLINNDSAVAIDNVVMVPEPGSWVLIGGLLAGFVCTRRKRRQRA